MLLLNTNHFFSIFLYFSCSGHKFPFCSRSIQLHRKKERKTETELIINNKRILFILSVRSYCATDKRISFIHVFHCCCCRRQWNPFNRPLAKFKHLKIIQCNYYVIPIQLALFIASLFRRINENMKQKTQKQYENQIQLYLFDSFFISYASYWDAIGKTNMFYTVTL